VRFKLDENLPVELLDDLRVAGHEADGLHDEGLIGAPDNVVLDLVRREKRVLLTLDKGIGDPGNTEFATPLHKSRGEQIPRSRIARSATTVRAVGRGTPSKPVTARNNRRRWEGSASGDEAGRIY